MLSAFMRTARGMLKNQESIRIKSVKVGKLKVIDNHTLFIPDGESSILRFDNKFIITVTTQISGCNRVEKDLVGSHMSFHLMVRDRCIFEFHISVCNSDVQEVVIFFEATRTSGNITRVDYNILAK